MKLKRRAALNGVQLDEIDERILIQGIEPAAGKDSLTTVSLWGGSGSRVTGAHRDSLDIIVKFSLDIKRGAYTERSEIFEKVMAWAAAGGWLTLTQKPGRKIRVICAQLPAEGDPLEWTNRYSITFRAHGVPYWQQESASQLRIAGTGSAARQFGVGGTAETVMDVSYKNTSGATVNQVDITCGGSAIHLRNLGVANGETLAIDHDDNGKRCVLRVRIQGTNGSWRSALSKRQPDSSNDLHVPPGIVGITLYATGQGTWLLSCAGRFA
jgi:hypothetical protein